MEKETVYWHLPGICFFGMINHVLFDTMKRFPDMFMDGYKIASVYGSFPGAIWNGGRNIFGGKNTQKEIEQVIKSYNALGIPVRFTWTNVLLEDSHCYDTYCNMIMDAGNNGMNQVLVNRPVLEEYIRVNYPNYKIVSSTTKRILNLDRLIDEISKDYHLVVLDYDLNHDDKVIKKLVPYADRIEILVNETCQAHCPDRVRHYKEISKYQLDNDTSIHFVCSDPNPDKHTFNGTMKCVSFMTNDDIAEYVKKGYKNFKIVGRNGTQELYIDSLVYFLVKPEYKDFIHKYLTDILEKMRNLKHGKNS